jgi:hypothetical protein
MERIGAIRNSDTNANGPALSRQDVASLRSLMQQTKAFYPNQTWVVPDPTQSEEVQFGTSDVHMKAWSEIALKYGIDRFRNALGNLMRRSTWFPMPVDIETECRELKILATEQQGSRLNVFDCECGFQCASTGRDAPTCRECGRMMAFAARGADGFNHERYMQDVAAHPEKYFGLATMHKEAAANIAARRRINDLAGR